MIICKKYITYTQLLNYVKSARHWLKSARHWLKSMFAGHGIGEEPLRNIHRSHLILTPWTLLNGNCET